MTSEALGMAIWTMILCSIGWVIFATFSASRMDKIEVRLSKGNAGTLTTIASCAIIGVFSAMCASHLIKPAYLIVQAADAAAVGGAWKNCLACVLGAIIMYVLNTLAAKKEIGWLKEWALTITIIAAMVITAII